MARWLLQYTLERLPKASKEAQARVNVSDKEKAKWQDIVDNIYLPEDKKLGISYSKMISWIKIFVRLAQFQKTNGRLISIGHGIGSCGHHLSSRQTFCKEFTS